MTKKTKKFFKQVIEQTVKDYYVELEKDIERMRKDIGIYHAPMFDSIFSQFKTMVDSQSCQGQINDLNDRFNKVLNYLEIKLHYKEEAKYVVERLKDVAKGNQNISFEKVQPKQGKK